MSDFQKRAKVACNWITNALSEKLTSRKMSFSECPIPADTFSDFIDQVHYGVVTSNGAKQLFDLLWDKPDANVFDLMFEHDLFNVENAGELEAMVDQLIADNPDKAEAVKTKPQARGWFVGQIMQLTNRKADPKKLNEILTAKL